VPDFQKKI